MSYHRQALGASLDTVGSAIQAASKIAEDPFLPEVICQILRLNKISAGQDPGPACPPTMVSAGREGKGIGLSVAVSPLRAFAWSRAHPIPAMAAAIGAVGAVFLLGYFTGRR